MPIEPGSIVDRYVVDSVLGRGGMAEVYRIRHQQLGSVHALKVLTTHSAAIGARLMQEGRAQAQLRHVNIVTVTDVVDLDGSPGLVMEYISGPTLAGLLEIQDAELLGSSRLSLAHVDLLARGIIAGVAAAHDHGLVHRDLKPSNILLEVSGSELVPKVADFGLVKIISGEQTSEAAMTRSGMALGTPAYMAPEQVRDTKTVDHRGDLFALGAILYEMLTSRRAFVGEDMMDIFTAVVTADRVPVESLRPEVPDRMQAAVRAALTVDLEARVQSCEELLDLWCGGASHTLPWDRDAVRWTPEDLAQIIKYGAGSAPVPVRRVATAQDGQTWSPGHPAGEGTLSREVDAPVSEALQPRRSRSVRWMVLLLAMASAFGGLWWWMAEQNPDATGSRGLQFLPIGPAAAPDPPPAPADVQETRPEPSPEDPKEHKDERREVQDEPERETPRDPPGTPDPPPPALEPVPTKARFSYSGPVQSVSLRGQGKLYGPGVVPPGTYQVYVRADNNTQRVGTVTVSAGQALHLECNRLGCR